MCWKQALRTESQEWVVCIKQFFNVLVLGPFYALKIIEHFKNFYLCGL